MDIILRFLMFTALFCLINGEVYSDGGFEGQSGVISCFFDPKFPGDVMWEKNGTEYTRNCVVNDAGDGILEKRDECTGTGDPGTANFTFTIISLDKNTDDNLWVCRSTGLDEPLVMDIYVLPSNLDYSGAQEVGPGENFELTATTSCQYPADKEIVWCVGSKCSDKSEDYWEGVFCYPPEETKSNISCDNYNSPMVYQLVSTISATTVESNGNNVLLYAKVNNKEYKTEGLTINFKNLFCGPFFLCIWIIILLIILITIFVIIYFLFRPTILPVQDCHFKLIEKEGIYLPLDPPGSLENIVNIQNVYFVLKDKKKFKPIATLNLLKGLVCLGEVKNYAYFATYYDGNPIFFNGQHPPRMTPDITNRTGFIVSYKCNNEHSQTPFLNIICDTYLIINENEHERIEASFASKIHQSIKNTPDIAETLKKSFATKIGVNDNGKNNCAISTENVRYQFQIYASTKIFKSPLMGILDRDLNVIGLVEDNSMVVSNLGIWEEATPIWQEGCCSSLFNRNTRLLRVQIRRQFVENGKVKERCDEFIVNGKVKGCRDMTNVSVLVGAVEDKETLLAIRNKKFNFIAIVSDEGMLKNVNCVNLYHRLTGKSVFDKDKLQPTMDLLLIHEYYLPFWERWELQMKKYYGMPEKQ